MESLITFIKFETWFLPAGLAFIVSYQILTWRININKILLDKTPTDNFSQEEYKYSFLL